MAKIKHFPRDCNNKCEHFVCWDLNVDDLTCYCKIAKRQIDLCDCDFSYVICPLGLEIEEDETKYCYEP